jgi:hypothetical protein
MGNDVKGAAARASSSRSFERVARVGYAASGVVHLLIAWIAGQVALGSSGEADEAGALQQLGASTGGNALLWVCAIGFAALALWHLVVAIVPRGGGTREQLGDRVKAVGKALVYGALAVTAFRVVTGSGADGGDTSSEATATLMAAPAGRILVGLLGLVVLGVGGYHVYKGAKRKFREDLGGTGNRELSRAVTVLGVVGYVAKGVALAVAGGLFLTAALQADPNQPTGLDAALKALRDQPLGVVLLLVVAVGLAAYGLYSFARARYSRM